MPPTLRDITISIKTLDCLIRKAPHLNHLQRTKALLHTHFDLIHASEDSNLRKQAGLSEDLYTTNKLRKSKSDSPPRAKSTPSVPRASPRVRTSKVYRRSEEEGGSIPVYVSHQRDDRYSEVNTQGIFA